MSKSRTDTTTTQPAEQGRGMFDGERVAIRCYEDGGDGSTVNEQQSRVGQLTYRCRRRWRATQGLAGKSRRDRMEAKREKQRRDGRREGEVAMIEREREKTEEARDDAAKTVMMMMMLTATVSDDDEAERHRRRTQSQAQQHEGRTYVRGTQSVMFFVSSKQCNKQRRTEGALLSDPDGPHGSVSKRYPSDGGRRRRRVCVRFPTFFSSVALRFYAPDRTSALNSNLAVRCTNHAASINST